MKTKGIIVAMTVAVCMALLSAAHAAEKEDGKGEIKYLGNKQCLMCHEGRDNSPSVWKASKHAGAYEALASDKAKKFSKDPQNDPKCVPCHVTGWGKTGGFSLSQNEKDKASRKGVTCEACHGPGQKYVVLMVKAKAEDKHDHSIHQKLADAGLIKPGEKQCLECHNKKSPFFKEFDFKKRVAAIKHGAKLDGAK